LVYKRFYINVFLFCNLLLAITSLKIVQNNFNLYTLLGKKFKRNKNSQQFWPFWAKIFKTFHILQVFFSNKTRTINILKYTSYTHFNNFMLNSFVQHILVMYRTMANALNIIWQKVLDDTYWKCGNIIWTCGVFESSFSLVEITFSFFFFFYSCLKVHSLKTWLWEKHITIRQSTK